MQTITLYINHLNAALCAFALFVLNVVRINGVGTSDNFFFIITDIHKRVCNVVVAGFDSIQTILVFYNSFSIYDIK